MNAEMTGKIAYDSSSTKEFIHEEINSACHRAETISREQSQRALAAFTPLFFNTVSSVLAVLQFPDSMCQIVRAYGATEHPLSKCELSVDEYAKSTTQIAKNALEKSVDASFSLCSLLPKRLIK